MPVEALVQSHLECLMQKMLEVEELKVRPDGQIGVTCEGGSFLVRVVTNGRAPHIDVYSVLLTEIDNDPGLLERLNELNTYASHVRVFWVDRRVIADGELNGLHADVDSLRCLCDEVTHLVEEHAAEIQQVFGGLLETEREDDL